MEKEDNQKPGREQPESEVKCDKEQYERLLRCSEKKDVTEWNEWRKEHMDEEIRLQGANLNNAHLENTDLFGSHLENAVLWDAHLENANLMNAHLENADLMNAHLKNANLRGAHLEKAKLYHAYLERANLWGVHLENTDLRYAHLENADLRRAHLENAFLWGGHLENAKLRHAHLQGAYLWKANLQNSDFEDARLQGTILSHANLKGAKFKTAIVDGETAVWETKIDIKTDFHGVGLANVRIDQATKQLLEYNIRRMNWEQWYRGKSKNKWINKMHQLLTSPVRAFWWVSNYGLSTWRIIFTFFALAFVFAGVYRLFPSCVMVNDVVGDIRGFWHTLYFSVVTMTTLGFGDIAANPDSWKGQGLLMLQVILGYVLLGSLITRFAVLFTAGGPAGTFSPSQIKETGKDKKQEA